MAASHIRADESSPAAGRGPVHPVPAGQHENQQQQPSPLLAVRHQLLLPLPRSHPRWNDYHAGAYPDACRARSTLLAAHAGSTRKTTNRNISAAQSFLPDCISRNASLTLHRQRVGWSQVGLQLAGGEGHRLTRLECRHTEIRTRRAPERITQIALQSASITESMACKE